MNNWTKKYHREICLVLIILGLVIISFILTPWFSLASAFYIVFSCVVILFLPGFFFTFIFFPLSNKTDELKFTEDDREAKPIKGLDWIERIIFSVFFSIILVVFTFVVMRYLDILLTPLVVLITIIYLNIVNFLGALVVNRERKRKVESDYRESRNSVKDRKS